MNSIDFPKELVVSILVPSSIVFINYLINKLN